MATTRSLTSSRKKKAFYEPPESQTSAQIIEEARRSVRALPTERPFTPADSGRILFGNRGSHSRPPSVYSIGARHFSDERLSRPPTGQKLAPIEKSLIIEQRTKVARNIKPTPPTPVQSTHDIMDQPSSRTTIASHSMVMMGGLENPSGSSISSTDDLEPKPSLSSPETSKRSLSAGQRVTSGGKKRVVSAGDERKVVLHSMEEFHQEMLEPRASKDTSVNQVNSKLSFWDTEVVPLLSELDEGTSVDVSRLCEVCGSLWTVLKRHDLLGRTGGVGGSKRRATVLRSVFKLLDHKDPRLLLKLSRIILGMSVTGKNLLNVCKLLFAVAKKESNDCLFLEEHISGPLVEILSMAVPLSDAEAMVYGLGTVKLLAGNPDIHEQLVSAGVVRLLDTTLQRCIEVSSSVDHTTKSHMENILVQLTSSLRNLSESTSLRPQLLSTGIIPRLSSVLGDHMTNTDIVFNVSRILSKLTLHADCREAVTRCPTFLPLFLQALTTHADSPDILVRVCFILGNLSSDDTSCWEQLAFTHSALTILEGLIEKYFTRETKRKGAKSSKKPLRKTEDVLIKLVRVVANLSVHPKVGTAVAEREATIELLIKIISCMPLSMYEELVVNTLATLNNLSYHAQPDSCIIHRQQEITELLVRIIMEDSGDGLLECIRVYGNLSRYPAVRDVLAQRKVGDLVVTLLDSGQREMVFSACGVLTNLMVDSSHREMLTRNGGIRKLVDVLHDFGHNDWQLAALVCKTLWNYSEKLTSSTSCFGEEETELLIQLLETYSKESPVLDVPPDTPEERTLLFTSWQNDFLPVAQSLLARIQTHHTDLVSLPDQD